MNEKIIKEIDVAIMKNRVMRRCSTSDFDKDCFRENNDLLGRVRTILKSQKEYEHGLEAGWELATNVVYMSTDDRFHAFGCKSPALTLKHHTASDALKLYNEYLEEQKKEEEEAAKLKLGDVVEVHNDINFKEKGVYLSGDSNGFVYLTSNGTVVSVGGCYANFKKTGEHVDIQGMLDKIG